MRVQTLFVSLLKRASSVFTSDSRVSKSGAKKNKYKLWMGNGTIVVSAFRKNPELFTGVSKTHILWLNADVLFKWMIERDLILLRFFSLRAGMFAQIYQYTSERLTVGYDCISGQ